MHSSQQIQLIADSLLSTFLPKDPNQTSLSFHFTLSKGKTYKVTYEKKIVEEIFEWIYVNYSEVKNL